MKKALLGKIKGKIKALLYKNRWGDVLHFINSITENQILTTAIVLAFVAVVVFFLSFDHYFSNDNYFLVNLLSEAHGMLFDLLIIGILLVWLNKIGEKRLRVRRYLEEIDDFRHWVNEEASFRIAGNVKRLNKDKVFVIDLYNCYLRNVNLNNVDLSGSNMNYVNLEESSLQNSIFKDARMNQANMNHCKLQKTNFQGAQVSGANFSSTTLLKADFRGANLIKTKFNRAVMIDANLSDSMIAGADFTEANLFRANLLGAKGLTAEQLSKARNVHMAKIDPTIEEKLKEIAPHLYSEDAMDFSITPNTPR